MELNEFFIFLRKISEYVAKVRDQNIPDTVLLFEPRMSHPALRVIEISFLFRFGFLFLEIFIENFKKMKKLNFFKFFKICHFFDVLRATFYPSHNL